MKGRTSERMQREGEWSKEKQRERRKRRTKIMVRVSNESAPTQHRWEETSFTMTEVDIEK